MCCAQAVQGTSSYRIPMISARPVLFRAPVALRAPSRQVALQRPIVVAQAAAADADLAEAPIAELEPSSDEARAILRFHRGSPFKVRRVLDAIRGRSYEDALKILTYLPHRCVSLSAATAICHDLNALAPKAHRRKHI